MTGTPRAQGFRWGILILVLLAFGLRLYAIDRQDIWGDEAFSIWLSRQPLPEVVAGGADTHPPLYPFLLYVWIRLTGLTPLAVRSLSALIGTLTVPVVYALSRRALAPLARGNSRHWTQRVSLLAASLAAVSPILVYYSQETRMYGLVTLLTAASVYWALCLLQDATTAKRWCAYVIVTLGAIYTHYYAFFVVAAQNLVAVLLLARRRRWEDLARWLGAQATMAMAYVPWVVVQSDFLSGKAGGRFAEWNLDTALQIAGDTVLAFGAGLAVAPPMAGWMGAAYLGVVLVGCVFVARNAKWELGMMAAWLSVPLLLAWAVNPIMPFFYARYLLLLAPAYCLLAAWGVAALGRVARPLGLAGALLLLAISSYGLGAYYTDQVFVRGRYGQMMAYVEEHARPGDGLILANPLQRPLFEYYQPEGLEAYIFPRYDAALEDPETAHDLEGIAARHPRLWLVRFGNPAEFDPTDFLPRWLATRGGKAYFQGWVDADLALYVMRPADSEAGQIPVGANLGDGVRLLGYALSAESVAPGEPLLLTLYWQALAPMDKGYTVFTHLLDESDQIRAQVDSEPQGGGLPTHRWTVGQVVEDNYALEVDKDTPPGRYWLEVGMYLLETSERLPVTNPDDGASLGDRVLLGAVEVVAP